MAEPCAALGCDRRRTKRDWCDTHYQQMRRFGEIRPSRWGPKGGPCVICGGPVPEGSGRRSHCSSRCQEMASRRRRGQNSIDTIRCMDCGATVDISTRPGERKVRSDRRRCDDCRSSKHRLADGRRITKGVLKRLGDVCALCTNPVDFSLRAPHPDSPSIDHKIPKALGGTDEDGLQLAHLRCNQIKSKRLVEMVSRG